MTRTLQTLALTWLLTQAVACGLGTEIGNGFKPDDRGDSSGGARKAASQAPDEDTTNESAAPTAGTPGAPGGASGGGSDGDAASDANTGAEPAPILPGAVAQSSFLLDALTLSCASPFAADLVTPVALKKENETAVRLSATFDAASSQWQLNLDGAAAVSARVAKAPVGSGLDVQAFNADGTPRKDRFTCGEKTSVETAGSANATTITQTTLELVPATGDSFQVTWTLQTDGSGSGKEKLVRVELLSPLAGDAKTVYVAAP